MEDRLHYTQGEPEQPYVEGCAQGHFAYARCTACGAAQLASRRSCVCCGAAEFEIERSSGEGTVASFTEVHRAASSHFAPQVPLVLVLADMDEGFRAMMQFRGSGEPKIGDRIRVGFAPYGPQGEPLPFAEHAGDGR